MRTESRGYKPILHLALNGERNARLFFWLFIVVSIVCAFPSKYLYYLAPFVFLSGIVFFHSPFLSLGRFLLIVFVLLFVGAISLLWSVLRGDLVNFPGFFLWFVTWSPIFILLAGPGWRAGVPERQAVTFVVYIAWFTLIQSVVGFVQFYISGNSDAVTGTFGLFDFMDGITITQVFYTFNLFMLVLFLLAYWSWGWLPKASIIMALLAVSLAQSGHQTIFYGIILFIVFMDKLSLLQVARAFLLFALLLSFVLYFYPNTLLVAREWALKTLYLETPKNQIVASAAELLTSDAKVFLLGTGPGQFSSRAALITSDAYLRVDLPEAVEGQSSWFTEFVLPLMELHREIGEGSAIAQPYFSTLTLVMELGVPFGVLGLLWFLVKAIGFRKLTAHKAREREVVGLARYCMGLLLFLVLNSFIENYMEFTQAIMLPILLYLWAQARIRTLV